MSRGGKIEKESTKGWITGWFYQDVWSYFDETSGQVRPWLRLHSGFTEMEAAQHIIDQAENGNYSYLFKAYQIEIAESVSSNGAFGTVEAYAKWQEWYIKECAKTGVFAYQTVSSWYTFQLVGAEFVMTAVDAQQNGLNWTHALDVIQVLPFLSKLEIPVSIRHTDGTEVGKVIKKADGTVQFIRASAGLYNIADIFPTARPWARNPGVDWAKSMLSQLTHNRCGQTCVEMLLTDWGVDPKHWTQALKAGDVGTSAEDLMTLLTNSIGNQSGQLMKMKAWKTLTNNGYITKMGMTMGELIEQAKFARPVIAMIKSPNLIDPHWVIVDGFELLDNGEEFVKLRDPGTGQAWYVPYLDFGSLFFQGGSQAISF